MKNNVSDTDRCVFVTVTHHGKSSSLSKFRCFHQNVVFDIIWHDNVSWVGAATFKIEIYVRYTPPFRL